MVNDYLLPEMRYKRGLSYTRYTGELMGCKIPVRFLLQPVVENSRSTALRDIRSIAINIMHGRKRAS